MKHLLVAEAIRLLEKCSPTATFRLIIPGLPAAYGEQDSFLVKIRWLSKSGIVEFVGEEVMNIQAMKENEDEVDADWQKAIDEL